jgi:hypothetical protein
MAANPVPHVLARARRWRALADAVAAALGLNVWITLVLVPAIFTGALKSTPSRIGALVPLAVLGIGLARRSIPWLLGFYPAALLAPIALAPRLVTGNVHGPWSFLLVSMSLVVYLFAVSWFSAFRDVPEPARVRPLTAWHRQQQGGPDEAVPARWRRRFRVYRALAALSVVLPLCLLYAVNFDADHLVAMRDRYAGKEGAMLAFENVIVLGLWLGLYRWAFLGVLGRHRSGDRELVAELAALERPQAARPGMRFYAYVVVALVTMGALVFLRYR